MYAIGDEHATSLHFNDIEIDVYAELKIENALGIAMLSDLNDYASQEWATANFATSAYVNDQIQLSVHHYNAGDGIIIEPYFNSLEMLGPASQTIHRVKINENYTATKSYVNEGHGYLFSDPHFTVSQSPYGKTIGLSDVCFTDDYYAKGTFDECLSAVRQYNSPEEVPLSAVVNAIWCLSKLQQ
jgi:hypothetical protein